MLILPHPLRIGRTAAPALLSILLFTGCGSASPVAGPTGADGGGEPKVTRLVFSLPPVTGEETNDMRNLSVPTMWPLRPMYEYLTGLDNKTDKIVPGLATSWNIEPDGRSMRFQLRKGIQYHHDHGEFSAQDVIHVWQEAIKQDSLTQTAAQIRLAIKDIEKVNDHEIIFRMNRPNANLLREWGEVEGSGTPIRSKLHFDRLGGPITMQTGPLAGTGPYQLKQRNQGVGMVYERTRWKHWRQTPDFQEFEFRFTREASTQMAQLLAGEAHLVSLPPDLVGQAEKAGMKTIRSTAPGLRSMLGTARCCNLNDWKDPSKGYRYPDNPLLDVRVRRALNKAINRDELNKAIFAAKGSRLVVNHFHPTRQGWNPQWERDFEQEYGYDPARSRAMLAEAGYSAARPLVLNIFSEPVIFFAGGQDVQEAVAGYWRNIGVNVTLANFDPAQRAAGLRQYQYPNHFQLHGTSSAQLLGTSTWNTGIQNISNHPQDAEVDAWVDELWVTLDEKKQDDLWRKVGDAMFYRHLQFPLHWLPAEALVNPAVVAGWDWPGSISGTWSHMEYIKAVRG